jgi:hypothetical protein
MNCVIGVTWSKSGHLVIFLTFRAFPFANASTKPINGKPLKIVLVKYSLCNPFEANYAMFVLGLSKPFRPICCLPPLCDQYHRQSFFS